MLLKNKSWRLKWNRKGSQRGTSSYDVLDDHGKIVCRLHGEHYGQEPYHDRIRNHSELELNASLVSAAPDLALALKCLLAYRSDEPSAQELEAVKFAVQTIVKAGMPV